MLPLRRFKGLYKPAGIPTIDWTQSTSYGLRSCWIPDGTGSPFDLVGITPPLSSKTGTSNIKNTDVGQALLANASLGVSNLANLFSPANNNSIHFAIVVAQQSFAASVNATLLAFQNHATANGRWGISLSSTNTPRLLYVDNSGTNQTIMAANTVAINIPFVIAASINQLSGNIAIYYNGVKTTGTITVQTVTSDIVSMVAGYNTGSYSNFFTGFMTYGAYYNTIPDDTTIWSMMTDPMAHLVYPQDRLLQEIVGPRAAGSVYNDPLWFGMTV